MGNSLMADQTGDLKSLHQLIVELDEVRQEIKRFAPQLAVRQADVKKKEDLLHERQQLAKRRRMDADERELALKTGEAKVRDLKVKLNGVKTNKEYSALQDEIRNFQSRNSALEEEILGMITDQEEVVAQAKVLEGELAEAKSEFEKFKELIDYKSQKLSSRVSLLETKIREAEAKVNATVLADFRRLAKTKGTAALSACHDGVCQNCFTQQTAQDCNNMLLRQAVHCKSCGAILYVD